jgi:hypothetical protein
VLPSPSTPAIAGVEAMLVAGAILLFGYLLADAVLPRRGIHLALRWGLAVPAVAAYILLLMLAHILTGGRVLSNAWLTRGLTMAAAAALAIAKFRRRDGRAERGDAYAIVMLAAASIVLIALVMWSGKVFRLLPLSQAGDIPWHMGMATELLNGETTPAASVTGTIPNYYPWLYQAMIAFLARFTPGGRAYHALAPLQLLHVAGAALALFALGREITGKWMGGVSTAFFGSIAGAFGRQYPGGATLRPYNVAFFNQPPPFPRDIGLLLLFAFLALLVAGLTRKNTRILVSAGIALGLAGLAGAESFFVGMGVAAVTAVLSPGLGRLRTAVSLIVPALAVYAIWLVPLVVGYLRLGGFVNITIRGPVNLTPAEILAAWGISVVLGAFGFIRWLPRARDDPGARVALVLVAVAVGVLLLSVLIPRGLGESFLALGRRHRYWPLLHLGVAIYAGLGASELIELAARWHRVVALGLGFILVALAVPSSVRPAFGRVDPSGGALGPAVRGDPDSLQMALAPGPGWRCVAAVPAPLDTEVFSYTGYRLVLYHWSRYTENLARIRWMDIYDHIPGDAERLAENKLIVTGTTDPASWRMLVRKYGVDVVVAPAQRAGAAPFEGSPSEWATRGTRQYLVVWVDSCDGARP